MPNPDGTLTAVEQGELSALTINLHRASPKSRKKLAEAIKQAHDDNPAFRPHLQKYLDQVKGDLDEPANLDDKPMTRREFSAAMAEDEGKRRENDAKRERVNQRQRLVESGKYTEESIKGLDAFAEEHGYTNYDHAAVLYAHENPPDAGRPTIGSAKQWEMPGGPEWRKNPRKMALNEAYKVVDELRGNRRA